MPNIKPISDLRNYSAVLQDVTVGSPVYLTRNGRGCYAIIDIYMCVGFFMVQIFIDFIGKLESTLNCLELSIKYQKLKKEFDDLKRGRKSGEENGWLSDIEVRKRFEERLNG